MTLATLPRYNGASIRVILDGCPALALIFVETDCIQVTSLCFIGRSRRCPLVRHPLSEAEIESITPVSRNELNSDITLMSQKDLLKAERDCGEKETFSSLEKRLQLLTTHAKRTLGRSKELRLEAERSVSNCKDAGERLQRSRIRKRSTR